MSLQHAADASSTPRLAVMPRPPRIPSPTTPGLPRMPPAHSGPHADECQSLDLLAESQGFLPSPPCLLSSVATPTPASSLPSARRRHVAASPVPSGPPLLRGAPLCQMLTVRARTSSTSRISGDVIRSSPGSSPPSARLSSVAAAPDPVVPPPDVTAVSASESPVCHHTRSRAAAGHSCLPPPSLMPSSVHPAQAASSPVSLSAAGALEPAVTSDGSRCYKTELEPAVTRRNARPLPIQVPSDKYHASFHAHEQHNCLPPTDNKAQGKH
ncbi:proline-rich protein 36-like [Stegodyphus dumicola]|uniref:proline-rich protein 36-like n=1 Tax=Stegodyphus dumicola TaxID=202533 RepID=UPI0015A7E287|nr:proline-rich protein 36-like [Stegodyphus dumicola]